MRNCVLKQKILCLLNIKKNNTQIKESPLNTHTHTHTHPHTPTARLSMNGDFCARFKKCALKAFFF